MEDYSSLDAFGFTSDQDHHHQGYLIEESLKKCLSTTGFATKPNSSSSPRILCFDNSSELHDNNDNYDDTNHQSCTMMKPKKEAVDLKFSSHDDDHHHQFATPTALKESNSNNKKNKRTYSSIPRSPFHAQDHLMAERKRREKLSQCLIALSAIVPGLKKTDKASVLGEAIKYLKELQERADTLEEKCKKRTIESVVLRKSQLQLTSDDHVTSMSNKDLNIVNDNDPFEEAHMLPEIEARILDEELLVRIHCERKKGVAAKILSEIEKLHLCVVYNNVIPFGSSTLDMTVVAKMESQFSMSMRDLVKTLRLALFNII